VSLKPATRLPRTRLARSPAPVFEGYTPEPRTVDELFDPDGRPHLHAQRATGLLNAMGLTEFRNRKRLADLMFRDAGVTFSVYSDGRGVERIFPFDPIPRVIGAQEWKQVARGLEQRITALNFYLADIYGDQRIIRDGILPREMLEASRGYLPVMRGFRPAGGTYVHVAGIDLIRREDGAFAVLEDNLRTPSGVSYVLENRAVMKRIYPQLFQRVSVQPVDEYPTRLREALTSLAPRGRDAPRTVVLTPGPHNSAYFEHCFLARRMGCELVQGSDLFVHQDRVYVKTTRGPERVHIIYRRIDDAFLDPEVFRADSLLGVPGLIRAYRAGKVTLANAVGNGAADDKAIYPFVPDMIRYYLAEEPVLEQVETYIGARPDDLRYILANLKSLVVKSVDEAGGYGMLMGPQATRRELGAFARKVRERPRGFIAQPLIELSTCPTLVGREVRPRRVDLRPYIITGTSTWILPGGLTRVALRKGSYVVNSSQGGGSKDTWVLGQGEGNGGDA
jgi:uncharacterized circularly permuted ATP-grasp superfamily protein